MLRDSFHSTIPGTVVRAFYIVGTAIVIAAVGTYFFMADQPQSNLPNETELETVHADSTAVGKSNELSTSNDVTEDSIATNADQTNTTALQPETPRTDSRKSINDDWCIANTELADSDFQLAQEQKREWDLARGDINLTVVKANPEAANAEYLQPYVELDKDDLIAHAKHDDKYALLVLAQRPDIDAKDRERAAKQLVILGQTSQALSFLIIREISQAQVAYQKADAVVPEVKKHVANILSYVKYGLTRKDPSALFTYLMFVQQHHEGQFAFDPESVLSDEELSRIDSHTQKLTDMLDSRRAKRYLPPIQDVEIPAIAYHDYDYELARAHYLFDTYLTNSRTVKALYPEVTERSPCVETILSHVSRAAKKPEPVH